MDEYRKLAAILVADVVGFSRLTGTDEASPWRGSVKFEAITHPTPGSILQSAIWVRPGSKTLPIVVARLPAS